MADMKRVIFVAAFAAVITSPVKASEIEDYDQAASASYRDSGVGSYSNVYGHGWTKVCCDYPYYHPSRLHRSRSRVRR